MKSSYKTVRVSIEVSDEDSREGILESTFRSVGDMTMTDVSMAIDRMAAACLADAKSKAYSAEAREYAEIQDKAIPAGTPGVIA